MPPWTATNVLEAQGDGFDDEVYRWGSSRHSRLWAWARTDRYRFVRMLCALLIAVFFALWSLGAVIPTRRGPGNNLGQPLRLTRDGTFQISIFEDLHFGESMSQRFPKFVMSRGLTICRCLGPVGTTARHLVNVCYEPGTRR